MLFTVVGLKGSTTNACKVHCWFTEGGTWYAKEDSTTIHFTVEDISDGVDLTRVNNVDTVTSAYPILCPYDVTCVV